MFLATGVKKVRSAGITVTLVVLAVLAAICAFPPSSQAGQPAFSDLSPGDPSYPFVKYLAAGDLIRGYPDGTFRPGGPVTRAEAAAMLAKAAGLKDQAPDAPTFTDVGPGHWACGVVEAVAAAGLVKGYPDGSFRPEGPVTRAEISSMLLRLTDVPLPAVSLPAGVPDVASDHWAASQIAASLAAGLLDMDGPGSFNPDAAATRSQVAKGLAVMINIRPGSGEVPLTGTVVPVKGEVLVKHPGGEFVRITGEAACAAGSAIKTAPGGSAELKFPDGSGLMIDSGTEINIIQAKGRATILRDGTSGATVDFLKLELPTGRIFGALASGHILKREKMNPAPVGMGVPSPLLLASVRLPAGLLLAEAEGEAPGPPWWQEPFEEKVRVEVDMPWGVAGIRGTFWMNRVAGVRQSTSVVSGSAQLTAGGSTVLLAAGQTSLIPAPGSPPAPPSGMTEDDQKLWQQVEDWVKKTAGAIQNNLPLVAPPAPPGVPPARPGVDILNSFYQSISGVMPPSVAATDPPAGTSGVPGDKSITITFSEKIAEGSAYGGIVLKDSNGVTIPVRKTMEGERLVIVPEGGLEEGWPVSGTITVVFDMDVAAAPDTSIRLSAGEDVIKIPASVSGNTLTGGYSGLSHGREYTVTIPAGLVQSRDHGTVNEEISWTFTTRPAPAR